MGRYLGWGVGACLALVVFAAPAAAQVHVGVGVYTPHVGVNVAVGPPPVYVAGPYYPPVRHKTVVVAPVRGIGPGRGRVRDYARRDREYVRDVRRAQREYQRELREARREYERDLREARRDLRRR